MEVLIDGLERLRRLLPRMGPYILVELVLPGGTLLALLLYLYRRRQSSLNQDSLLRTAIASIPMLAPGGSSPSSRN